jgi:hypothetical protein
MLTCGHTATVPGPHGATTGRAWCPACGASEAAERELRTGWRELDDGTVVAVWPDGHDGYGQTRWGGIVCYPHRRQVTDLTLTGPEYASTEDALRIALRAV